MLTEHVSEVNKTRLTNVYDSVEAYNADATGLTIPYHVLVLDSFPAGFTDRLPRCWRGLAGNGPRAGVYILATLDRGMTLPRDFDLADLTSRATNLTLRAGARDLGRPGVRACRDRARPDARRGPGQRLAGRGRGRSAAASRDLPFAQIAVPPRSAGGRRDRRA